CGVVDVLDDGGPRGVGFAGGAQAQGSRTVAHEGGRGVEDRRSGTVIVFEAHDGRVGVTRAELEQVLGFGARERVNRLARVTHHADVTTVAQPQLEQTVLQRRNVLVLVDREV